MPTPTPSNDDPFGFGESESNPAAAGKISSTECTAPLLLSPSPHYTSMPPPPIDVSHNMKNGTLSPLSSLTNTFAISARVSSLINNSDANTNATDININNGMTLSNQLSSSSATSISPSSSSSSSLFGPSTVRSRRRRAATATGDGAISNANSNNNMEQQIRRQREREEAMKEKRAKELEAKRLEFNLVDDCFVFNGLWHYCTLIAGASLQAVDQLISGSSSIVINWGGGRHHAMREQAAGFCYVNDIVLAILRLLEATSPVILPSLTFTSNTSIPSSPDPSSSHSLSSNGPRNVMLSPLNRAANTCPASPSVTLLPDVSDRSPSGPRPPAGLTIDPFAFITDDTPSSLVGDAIVDATIDTSPDSGMVRGLSFVASTDPDLFYDNDEDEDDSKNDNDTNGVSSSPARQRLPSSRNTHHLFERILYVDLDVHHGNGTLFAYSLACHACLIF
jgi:hypothetical protein